MPIHLTPDRSFAEVLAEAGPGRPVAGAWSSLGSALSAEIIAGSGLDFVLIDAEHGPNDLSAILSQLQATAAYPVATLVRVPFGEPVFLKQVLDLGATNLLVPMVDTPKHAEEMVRAVRYPPHGVRGVGSALARSARWNRVPDYLRTADGGLTLVVQLETRAAVEHAEEIAAVDGVDAVLVGPADLAASLGHLGDPEHPEVVEAVHAAIAACRTAGTPVGVNAFVPAVADRWLEAGAAFVIVGSDVSLLARATEGLADRFAPGSVGEWPP